MSGKTNKTKKIIRTVILVVAVVMLISSAILFMQAWEKNRGVFSEADSSQPTEVFYNGKEYELKDSIETFLVLGLDKFDDFEVSETFYNDKQADFLMLFVFDDVSRKCVGIQINRDTMVDVNVLGVAGNKIDSVKQQIALAHTYGNGRDVSCRNTADSVSYLLNGIKVNHYISLTLDSVGIVNDSIGGVTLEVLDDFAGIDDSLVKGETVTLKGEQALRYVRTRQGLEDSSNISRMTRQRQYLEAFYQKSKELSANDEDFAFETLTKLSEYIVSDRSITQMRDLADKFVDYEFIGIKTINGDAVVGDKYMEFYADKDSVDKIVFGIFYREKTK